MRNWILLLLTLHLLPVSAQSYEAKVRLLEQHGIPFFYNQDIEKNIQLWVKNENNVTSNILGKGVVYHKYMEDAQRINGLPWFVKYIPAANTGYDNYYVGGDGSTGMWPLTFAIAKKYGLKQNSMI